MNREVEAWFYPEPKLFTLPLPIGMLELGYRAYCYLTIPITAEEW